MFGGNEITEPIYTIDHVKPRSAGGGNSLSNLELCCQECNQNKGNKWLQ